MSFVVPMSSPNISDAPIELQAGVDVCTGDTSITAGDGRLGGVDRDEPDQFRCYQKCFELICRFSLAARPLLLERWNIWDDDGFGMATTKEKGSLHCSGRACKILSRFLTSSVVCNDMPLSTGKKIFPDSISALPNLHSTLGRIIHMDLKLANILLDEKMVAKISDFGTSRVFHAHHCAHIPMGKAVPFHIGPLGIERKMGSPMTQLKRNLCVNHHPLIQMLPPARKWSEPKYQNPSAGRISGYMTRTYYNVRKWLSESQQYSEPDYYRPGHGKMAANTKTSACWIIATAAPHHATGNRNLLSGFIMEHDDQFVHAVNRVPMKVLARGAVVTDALVLPDVWFVPGLTENLVSVSQLAELDHSIGFGRGVCCIRSARDAKIVGKGRLQKGGHYELDFLKVPLAI